MKENIKIGIIGLGYVGLPLARLFATKYSVIGFDINQSRIKNLNQGIDSTLEVDEDVLKKVIVDNTNAKTGLYCTNSLNDLENCNAYLPTK